MERGDEGEEMKWMPRWGRREGELMPECSRSSCEMARERVRGRYKPSFPSGMERPWTSCDD